MKVLAIPRVTARSAVIQELGSKLRLLFDVRATHISKMSGYPSALHSIGRLQRLIKTSSFHELLASVQKIRDIAQITADVIDTLDGTKMDRYQINRVEIIAYVKNMLDKMPDMNLDEDDMDLVSNLVTSFEANPANWVLQSAIGESNLHLQMYDLYKEVLLDDQVGNLGAYSPQEDRIMKFAELAHVKRLVKTGKKKPKEGEETGDKEASANSESRIFKDAGTFYRLAACRVIDHVYQLLMDKDIWYAFVAPRTKADVTTNLARAQSLRVLYTYCQAILTYYQFFSLEMFMSSYDIVQKWIAQFPPLEASVAYELEDVIRKHDLLGAKQDVQTLLDSFGKSAEADLGALVFPSEFTSKFGLYQAVSALNNRVAAYQFAGDLTSIEDLNKPQYIPILSGTSIGVLDAIPSMTTLIITHKIVSNEIREAMTGLVPAFTRGSRKADIEHLRSLNVKAGMPFSMPHSSTYQVAAGVEKGVEGGLIILDGASPMYSFHYHQYLRDTMKFKMKTDRTIAEAYKGFNSVNIVDKDRATELRGILETSWRTLVPAFWATGDKTYTIQDINASYEKVKQFIEDMVGQSYDVFVRELTLDHIQRMFATIISSFGLLYKNEDDMEMLSLGSSMVVEKNIRGGLTLVTGYGMPYGTAYNILANSQPPMKDDTPLIKVGMGIYIRMLNNIPIVTDKIDLDQAFYGQRPVFYFASNSTSIPVNRWVLSEGMQNFTLIPVQGGNAVPNVTITPKHVFLTQKLYVNYDLYYKPSVAEKGREQVPINVTVREWNFARHQFFLEYRTFGPYSSAAVEGDKMSDEQLTKIVKDIENIIVADEKEASNVVKDAGSKVKSTLSNIEGDAAGIHKKNTTEANTTDPGHEITL